MIAGRAAGWSGAGHRATPGWYRSTSQGGPLRGNAVVSPLASGGRIDAVEASVTADNRASIALFESFARRHGGCLHHSPLFISAQFPDQHLTEELIRVPVQR
jgi:L-2,4-diaminobutyric acid acetyltransferase